MGGGHRADLPVQEVLQDGLGQCRAFCRIGAGAELVKQHQILVGNLLHDGDDVGHMGRKGGKGLLNGLLVSNVGEHLVENGQLRPKLPGDLQAGLGHQGKQADGFKRHGFAARIRAGNDQGGKGGAQLHRTGNDLFRVDQRMADTDQADDPVLVQFGGNGPHLPGQLALGKYKIQMGQKNDVLLDHVRLFADGGGQGGEDPFDLFPLLGGPFADLVAELDDRQRLHKQGSARGTLILHDARDIGAEFGADGNHVPAVSDGDDGLLQILGHLAPDHLAELGTDLLVGLGDVPADVVQGGAGVIRHFLFAQNRAGNVLLQLPESLETGGLGGDHRGVFPLRHQAASGGAGGPQGFRHRKESLLRKGGALLRQGKIRPHVRKPAQRIAALIGQDDDGFFRFALCLLDFAKVRKRNQLAAFFLAQVGQGIIGQL